MLSKKIIPVVFGFLFLAATVHAQENKIQPTDKFVITGKVKKELSFSLDDAAQYTMVKIDSMVVYNHLMERRHTVQKISGVLLKDIINKAGIDMASPKALSEIYITCIASDNYKVVFSWNELFNTEVGKKVIIVTESDGQAAQKGKDRIALLSAADQATGRRFVKCLSKVLIEQVK